MTTIPTYLGLFSSNGVRGGLKDIIHHCGRLLAINTQINSFIYGIRPTVNNSTIYIVNYL